MKNLANELRPKTLNDIIGQTNTINLLKNVAKNKILSSFIFFGEAGTGKTSTANALANDLGLKHDTFNASVGTKNELIKLLQENEVVIIDEIHRLNVDKQDILLSYLEYDKVIIYATTTENPYFRVNPALRSRMQILQFNKLTEEELYSGIQKNLKKYFPKLILNIDTLKQFVKISNGDYRSCLNNLQMLALVKEEGEISLEDIKKILPNMTFYSDFNSSAHYNNLSAFHKSLRGSDVDAALYYGALILKTGDFQGLFRRLLCCSYEDVGLADPTLPQKVHTAFKDVEQLGFPEANLPIYYAIIMVALARKSNSVYKAITKTEDFLNNGNVYEVPKHLRDSHYKSASKLGYGIDYKYPHDFAKAVVKQIYLPNKIKNERFFELSDNDVLKISTYYEEIQKIKGE
ncbi:AAA family ATPase [Mycoplasmopsis felifaucium]|uniref:AAA family ATPase n=1 Tax=Mycoplasmopsis felifaucium TaxID=35768 RepID=UPI000482AEED|nr:AAA family ATPase [Mycoplasmopsis felifaucium]